MVYNRFYNGFHEWERKIINKISNSYASNDSLVYVFIILIGLIFILYFITD